MSQVKNRKPKFSEWIMTYRKLILLVLFFVVLPFIVLVSLYSGTKANGNKVYFDSNSSTFVKTKKFVDVSKFDAFNLEIDYTEVKTLYSEVTDEYEVAKEIGKKYTFSFTYENNQHNVTNVSITPVLVGPWSSFQALSSNIALTRGTSRSVSIDFKKVTPYRPLLFVNIENPYLYLQVKYTNAGHELISYVSFNLASDNEVKVS